MPSVAVCRQKEVKALKFKVPGGVATTIGGLIFLLFIIGLIGYHPDTRILAVCRFRVDCCAVDLAGCLNAATIVSWLKTSNTCVL
ncbi:hypothetical protein LAD67_17665 [Escherichia coli]|nr:hypothetical protein [Escherichia coli]